jgi:hypothetical protein
MANIYTTLVINEKQNVDVNTFYMEINIINIIVSCFDKRIIFYTISIHLGQW